jgi:hypothetical protein
MDKVIGFQRFVTVGNVNPTNTSLRLYSLNIASTISTSNIALYNGLTSSSGLLYLRCTTDSQGTLNQEWQEGVLFDKGIWLNTGAGGTVTTIVGYCRSEA